MRGPESGERAGLQQIDRPHDEVVIQSKVEQTIGAVGADCAIGERRIADGEVGRAEASEADQIRLLFDSCRPLLLLDLGGEPDRGDAVARPGLPASGESTVAVEDEVCCGFGCFAERRSEVPGAEGAGSGSSSWSLSAIPAKAVTPRSSPEDRAVLPKRSMVKGSSCAMVASPVVEARAIGPLGVDGQARRSQAG